MIVNINDLVEFTDFMEDPANVDENQISGTFVSTLTPIALLATDTHTYALSSSLSFPDNTSFVLQGDSLLTTTDLNFEIQSQYTLLFEVSDKFGTVYQDTFIVDVNDLVEFTGFMEDPANIDENQIAGTFVSTLTPIALLTTDTHTYALSSSLSFPDNTSFVLQGDSLLTTTDLNFEIQSQYTLLFDVTDKFGTVYQDTFIVDVNDLVEFTDFIENPAYIDENQYPGAFVTALTPIAILATDTHTYLLSTDTVNFPDNNAFTLTNDTILSNQSFDFEIKNQYNLLIEVTDKFGTVYLDTFIVYINGLIEFTDFVDDPVNFDENQDADLLITTLTPIAILATDTHIYTLSNDTINFPDNLAFTLNTDSLISNWNYDYETQNIYTLLIEVRDRFDTMYLDTFIVNINDRVEFTEFDENPVFIDENTGPEILVSSLTPIAILATDIHTYTLSADTTNFPDNNMFWIQRDSLINRYNFDYEMQEEYTLLIEVRDRFDTMYLDTFIVNINDLDEFEYFEEDPIYFDENQAIETVVSVLLPVGNLPEEELTYSLSVDTLNFPDNNAFVIIEDELLSAEIYSYEDQIEYNILVEVRNEFGTLYLDSMLVIINDLIEFDDLKVTNFVTPNEDGKNDYFAIPNPELFSDYTLRIFNDNGNEVFFTRRKLR